MWKKLMSLMLGLLVLGMTVGIASAAKVPNEHKNILSIEAQKEIMEQYSRLKAAGKVEQANRLLSQHGFVKLGEEKVHQKFNKPINMTQEELNSGVSIQSWVSERDLTLEIEYTIYPAAKTLWISYYWTWDLVEEYFDQGDMDEISITNAIGQLDSGQSYWRILVDYYDAYGYEIEWGMIPGNHDVELDYEGEHHSAETGVLEHQLIFKVGDSIKKGVIHVIYKIHDDVFEEGGGISAHMIYTHTYGNARLVDTITSISHMVTGFVVKHPLLSAISDVTITLIVHEFEHSGIWRSTPVDKYIWVTNAEPGWIPEGDQPYGGKSLIKSYRD